MRVHTFTVGLYATNCYIANCAETNEAIIIDPGFDEYIDGQEVLDFLNHADVHLKLIINTHGHPDHTCGNGIIKDKFNIPILIHKYDSHMIGPSAKALTDAFGTRTSPKADCLLNDGDVVRFGRTCVRVIHTPGHSKGGISLQGDSQIFTGDTLFAGSIGRTDFPESSTTEMAFSLRKLRQLPMDLDVYPGHGPRTRLSMEKSYNPFLRGLL